MTRKENINMKGDLNFSSLNLGFDFEMHDILGEAGKQAVENVSKVCKCGPRHWLQLDDRGRPGITLNPFSESVRYTVWPANVDRGSFSQTIRMDMVDREVKEKLEVLSPFNKIEYVTTKGMDKVWIWLSDSRKTDEKVARGRCRDDSLLSGLERDIHTATMVALFVTRKEESLRIVDDFHIEASRRFIRLTGSPRTWNSIEPALRLASGHYLKVVHYLKINGNIDTELTSRGEKTARKEISLRVLSYYLFLLMTIVGVALVARKRMWADSEIMEAIALFNVAIPTIVYTLFLRNVPPFEWLTLREARRVDSQRSLEKIVRQELNVSEVLLSNGGGCYALGCRRSESGMKAEPVESSAINFNEKIGLFEDEIVYIYGDKIAPLMIDHDKKTIHVSDRFRLGPVTVRNCSLNGTWYVNGA